MAKEETGIRWGTSLATGVAIAGFALSWFTLPDIYDFPTALDERLALALRACVFIVLTLLVAVGMVSTARRASPEDIGGAAAGPPSAALAVKSAFLQNTLEQSVIAVVTLMAFSTIVSGPSLALVPAAVVMFVVGRILFYRGYPGGAGARSFGMGLTLMPFALLLLFASGSVLFGLAGMS